MKSADLTSMSSDSSACRPLTVTRSIAEYPIANRPLAHHRQELLDGAGLHAHPHAWLDPREFAAFLTSGAGVLLDADGTALAWRGDPPDSVRSITAGKSFLIRHPWDFLRANEQYGADLAGNIIEGNIHPSAVIEGVIHLGAGSRILPGVFVEGNVVIGANCKIGPNCYLRGSTSIGDDCHIGQAVEIKNCLILSHTNVGHLSYVGDSVLGEHVNFGAGTITANFRHDNQTHRSAVNGVLIDTGRLKLGAIVGDGVHTGIHTSIYPGRKLWPNTSTRPGEIVQRDIEA